MTPEPKTAKSTKPVLVSLAWGLTGLLTLCTLVFCFVLFSGKGFVAGAAEGSLCIKADDAVVEALLPGYAQMKNASLSPSNTAGYAIFCGRLQVALLGTREEAQRVLDAVLAAGAMEGAQTTFADDVHIAPSVGRVLGFEEALWTVQGGADALPYKVDAGESVLVICGAFSMSEQDYLGLNSSAGGLSVFPGQLITVRSGKKPLLSVRNVKVSKQTKDLPYATKTVSDSTLMKGTSAVKQAGAAGVAECTTTVTYIDGVETARTTGEFVTIREPVDRIVGQGTKRPSDYSSAPSFAWPLTGTLSSPFGPRWGRMHYGIDLAVPTGTNVKAAAGGTVLRAFSNGGYGLFVEIDHGNGWITRYGHNSKLLVKAGDKVSRGTSIAKSGNTGDSTGPHLHFEIRKSGTAVNPLFYLP